MGLRIVLDTNVLISGTFWHGPPSRILASVERGELELFVSEAILAEYSRVLSYAQFRTSRIGYGDCVRAAQALASLATVVVPTEAVTVVVADPDDNKFLEAALAARAAYVVSGDSHLLQLDVFRGIRIVSPEQFLRLHDGAP